MQTQQQNLTVTHINQQLLCPERHEGDLSQHDKRVRKRLDRWLLCGMVHEAYKQKSQNLTTRNYNGRLLCLQCNNGHYTTHGELQKLDGCKAYATSAKTQCNISQQIMTLIFSTTTCVTYAQRLLCVRTHHAQVVFVGLAGCMAAEHSGIRSEYRHSLY